MIDGARALARRFNEHAARPPSRWNQLISVILAIALPVWLWDARGPIVGVVALLVYTPLLLVGAFAHERLLAWSTRSRSDERWFLWPLTTSPLLVLTFLALAAITTWPLGRCLLAGVGAWLLFAGFILIKRHRLKPSASSETGGATG
jgi:hypothetical protein